MSKRTIIYTRQNGTDAEHSALRQAVEMRGDKVIGTFTDDPAILGRGKYSGWRELMAALHQADQVVVGRAGDLPGRSVADLLKIVSMLNDHGVALYLHRENIDTDSGASAFLDLVAAYRAAKSSEAIRAGLAEAKNRGQVLGRPAVPDRVRRQIQLSLNSAGIRPTARKFNVSPGTVINIRRSTMDSVAAREAA
jgi:DNA invertase Pin-like site-specific DNA recombinase